MGGASALGSASNLSLGILSWSLCWFVIQPHPVPIFSNFKAHCIEACQLRPAGAQPGIKWNRPYSAAATSQGGLRRLSRASSEDEGPEDRGWCSVILRSNWGGGSDGGDTAEKPRQEPVSKQRGWDGRWWERASLRSKGGGRFVAAVGFLWRNKNF